MARGKNAERRGHAGKEYWKSRLHCHGEEPGRYTKQWTHRKERRAKRCAAEAAMAAYDPYESSWKVVSMSTANI